MKLHIVVGIFVFCGGIASAGQQPDPWLNIVKSEHGFLFQGHLGRTAFSFDIPGDQIKVAEQKDPSDPARTSIDEIFFQVMPVKKSDFPSTNSDLLTSYRKSEQKYQKEHFGPVVLSELDVCKGSPLKHQSWQLGTLDLKAPAQVFMAVKAGDHVIVISSAFANAEEKEGMLNKFSGFCKSFQATETK
jgi:hypothetical protein